MRGVVPTPDLEAEEVAEVSNNFWGPYATHGPQPLKPTSLALMLCVFYSFAISAPALADIGTDRPEELVCISDERALDKNFLLLRTSHPVEDSDVSKHGQGFQFGERATLLVGNYFGGVTKKMLERFVTEGVLGDLPSNFEDSIDIVLARTDGQVFLYQEFPARFGYRIEVTDENPIRMTLDEPPLTFGRSYVCIVNSSLKRRENEQK